MTGMIVVLSRLNWGDEEFDKATVFPDGRVHYGPYTKPDQAEFPSQLLAIRTLMLRGYKLTEPNEWGEAEV